jgi:hypothetical protein
MVLQDRFAIKQLQTAPVKTEEDAMRIIAVFVWPIFTAQVVNLSSHQQFVLEEMWIQIDVEVGDPMGFVASHILSTMYQFPFTALFRATFVAT